MGQFGIEYSQATPSGQSGNVRASLDVDTGQGAIAQAVSFAGQELANKYNEIQAAEESMQFSEGQRKIKEAIIAAQNNVSGDETADDELWKKTELDIEKIQYKSDRVNAALQEYVNSTMPQSQNQFSQRHLAIKAKNVHDNFEANGQTLLAKGDLTGYQSLLESRLSSKDISMEQYKALSKSAENDSAIQQSRDLIATGTAESNDIAIALLSEIPEKEDVSTEQKEYVQKLLSVARKQKDGLSEESNKQLTDLMASGNLSIDAVRAKRRELTDTDYQAWTKIAMSPADKRGNVIQATELKSLAIDVWRGSLSRVEAESKIRASLADPNGINEKQYAAIYSDLDREVKGYQAQDMKTYSIEATRLILGKDAGVMSFDALGNMTVDINKMLSPQEDFEKKMRYVDLYNKQMSDYLAENPKASKKEMYVKSQELKATYLSASKGESVEAEIVSISTDAEWEALEPGQKFKGPDGIVRVK